MLIPAENALDWYLACWPTRTLNAWSHTFLFICLLTTGVSVSHSLRLCTLRHRVSRSTPFPDSGASCLLYRFQEVGKTSLEFPCLPGGENRLRCHPCPNLSPRWSGKQTAEPHDRTGGTQGLFEQSPRWEMRVSNLESWDLTFHLVSFLPHSFLISTTVYLYFQQLPRVTLSPITAPPL